jgi:hypothetical protein
MKQLPVLLSLSIAIALLGQTPRGWAEPSRTRHRIAKSISGEETSSSRPILGDGAVLNLLRASNELPAVVWKRLLEVQSANGTVLGYYLIFNLHGTFFAYSPNGGSRRIWPAGKSPTAFARATFPGSSVSGIFFAFPL